MPSAHGQFGWRVPPSLRPSESRSACIPESYTLTCARPDDALLQTAQVTAGCGETAKVDLSTCVRKW